MIDGRHSKIAPGFEGLPAEMRDLRVGPSDFSGLLGIRQDAIRRSIDRVAGMLLAGGRVEGAIVHREVMAIAGGYFVSKESTNAEGMRKLRFAQATIPAHAHQQLTGER